MRFFQRMLIKNMLIKKVQHNLAHTPHNQVLPYYYYILNFYTIQFTPHSKSLKKIVGQNLKKPRELL